MQSEVFGQSRYLLKVRIFQTANETTLVIKDWSDSKLIKCPPDIMGKEMGNIFCKDSQKISNINDYFSDYKQE